MSIFSYFDEKYTKWKVIYSVTVLNDLAAILLLLLFFYLTIGKNYFKEHQNKVVKLLLMQILYYEDVLFLEINIKQYEW